jgi:drug/metabolite transporter (DMT)-like permease
VSRARAAEVGLIGVAAVWGATFVVVQDAVAKLPTLAFLGYRFLAAAVVVALVWRSAVRALPAAGWRAGALMGVFLTLGYVLQTLGLEHTTVSNAGFITGLFVVLTPVLAAVVLRDRIGPLAWAAAIASAVGLFLLSGGGTPNTGDVLVLGCAFAFAAHILATSRAAALYDTGALLVVQLALCGAVCTIAALVVGDLHAPPDRSVWMALAVTALLASALGFFIQTYAQKHTSATRTALILASEPAFTALCGYLFNDERLEAIGWLGAALIMSSIVVVELRPRLRPPRPLPEEA